MNNTIRGTGVPTNSILTNLREAIEAGEILVVVAMTQAGYKETQLIDKATGLKIIPEHIVPRKQEPIIIKCYECKKRIDKNEPHISTHYKNQPETLLYYHKQCHLLKGTTSSNPHFNGNISDNDEK